MGAAKTISNDKSNFLKILFNINSKTVRYWHGGIIVSVLFNSNCKENKNLYNSIVNHWNDHAIYTQKLP